MKTQKGSSWCLHFLYRLFSSSPIHIFHLLFLSFSPAVLTHLSLFCFVFHALILSSIHSNTEYFYTTLSPSMPAIHFHFIRFCFLAHCYYFLFKTFLMSCQFLCHLPLTSKVLYDCFGSVLRGQVLIKRAKHSCQKSFHHIQNTPALQRQFHISTGHLITIAYSKCNQDTIIQYIRYI